VIDSGYITAFAALGGAALGGLTSFATSWTTLRIQRKSQRSASSKSKRQKLYKAFIDDAARIYGDALIHDKLETTGLIDLHALVSRMRIVSSGPVIETAVNVVKVVTETYSQPNKSPEEIEAMISNGNVDILRSFSEACRDEFEQSLEI
jgi:CRISPR/Cas system CSM-associated protein Csm4 (group 5 of RAMP superfamily)